jgi:hypothetical protein
MKIHEEDGQALLLALAFLFFGALVIGAMLTFAYVSASSTLQLEGQRNTVYAADGATDAAIQVGRVDTTVGGYGDARCQETVPTTLPSSPKVLLTTTTKQNNLDKSNQDITASVICTWSQDQFQPERTVTFTTFVSGGTIPVVQATVIYHDATAGAGMPKVDVISWTYCGHSTSC